MTNPVDEAMKAKIQRGEIELVEPLDYVILESLVEEGTTMSGMYPLGTMVREISRKLKLSSDVISGRIRYMKACGYTKDVRALGGGSKSSGKHAWQRTKAGDEVLKAWKEKE